MFTHLLAYVLTYITCLRTYLITYLLLTYLRPPRTAEPHVLRRAMGLPSTITLSCAACTFLRAWPRTLRKPSANCEEGADSAKATFQRGFNTAYGLRTMEGEAVSG